MTKIKLSDAEMELVNNSSFILTKNNIIRKVYDLMGDLQMAYKDILQQHHLPDEVVKISPKISKGENYEGLPWVMLDYPRYFTGTDVFAIRTFFWWGHFFSITLQTKGKYKLQLQVDDNKFKMKKDLYLCCNENEWQHHFREDNYLPFVSFTQEQIDALSFIKLSTKIPLQEWDNVYNFLSKNFNELIAQSVK
jgi:hypothetical protein